MTVGGLFSGIICNRIGVRWTLVIGTLGYAPYAGTYTTTSFCSKSSTLFWLTGPLFQQLPSIQMPRLGIRKSSNSTPSHFQYKLIVRSIWAVGSQSSALWLAAQVLFYCGRHLGRSTWLVCILIISVVEQVVLTKQPAVPAVHHRGRAVATKFSLQHLGSSIGGMISLGLNAHKDHRGRVSNGRL
jgi:MFS family permease